MARNERQWRSLRQPEASARAIRHVSPKVPSAAWGLGPRTVGWYNFQADCYDKPVFPREDSFAKSSGARSKAARVLGKVARRSARQTSIREPKSLAKHAVTSSKDWRRRAVKQVAKQVKKSALDKARAVLKKIDRAHTPSSIKKKLDVKKRKKGAQT